MSNLDQVREKNVTLNVGGKDRILKYDLNAMAELEDVYGDLDGIQAALSSFSSKALRKFLWAGLIHEDPNLTEKERYLSTNRKYYPGYYTWQQSVLKRDKYTCRKCGQVGRELVAHHIQNFSDFRELRCDVNNGITFCKKCHQIFHKKYTKLNNTREQLNEFLQ